MCVYIYVYIYIYIYLYIYIYRSLSAKEPLVTGLFFGKWPVKDKTSFASSPPCINMDIHLMCNLRLQKCI